MTPEQKRLIDALYRVSFVPGTGAKRIVRSVGNEISPRMEACLWRIAYTFRRQLPRDVAEEAVRRKVDHVITGVTSNGWYLCALCGGELAKRSLNTPCPGPREPKHPKAPKRRSAAEQAAVPAAKSPNEAAKVQEELF